MTTTEVLTKDDIVLIQMALRTRYDHLKEVIARNMNEVIATCIAEQNHIRDLKWKLKEMESHAI